MLGARITSVLGFAGFGVHAPCLVVAVIVEPDRVGWADGTLPGHPECGEEAFLLTLLPNDDVLFEVRAFSRAAVWRSRVLGPAGRATQRWVTNRNLPARAQMPPMPTSYRHYVGNTLGERHRR